MIQIHKELTKWITYIFVTSSIIVVLLTYMDCQVHYLSTKMFQLQYENILPISSGMLMDRSTYFYKTAGKLEPRSGPTYVKPDLASTHIVSSSTCYMKKTQHIKIKTFRTDVSMTFSMTLLCTPAYKAVSQYDPLE